jgi:hypothetical protein
MTKLTKGQMLYLLYADAYSEAGTVTKGTVKPHLPSEWQEKVQEIYDVLETQKLIVRIDKAGKPTKREGRLSVTPEGKKALATNLATTDYEFDSSKGYKVLNTLLTCIQEAAQDSSQFRSSENEEMTFAEFQQKFKTLYFEERKRQELGGVVAIHKKELIEKFQAANSVTLSSKKLNEYFGELKSSGKVFISKGEKDELIHWVE